MSKPLLATLALAGALLAGSPAFAQDVPPPPSDDAGPPPDDASPPPDDAPPPPGYAQPRMSRGGGHAIARADVPALVAETFALVDTRRAGFVTRDDYRAYRDARRAEMMERHGGGDGAPPPGGGGPRPPRGAALLMGGPGWFESADTNGDGRVTLSEARAAALATFDRLDANHDGVVDPDERRAGMMAMGGGRSR